MIKRILLLFTLSWLACGGLYAQQQLDTLAVRLYFRRGISKLDLNYRDNQQRLDDFVKQLQALTSGPNEQLPRLSIISSASPEGTTRHNQSLSVNRGEALKAALQQALPSARLEFDLQPVGVGWERLVTLLQTSAELPYREEILTVIANTPEDSPVASQRKHQLMSLRGGRVWNEMQTLFPELRRAELILTYPSVRQQAQDSLPSAPPTDTLPTPAPPVIVPLPSVSDTPDPAPTDTTALPLFAPPPPCYPLYMAVKTNLLYDAVAVPNIGVEFHFDRNNSLAVNWMYAWWRSDRLHRYWRVYGGDMELRRWFGKRAAEKPLTGHHIGLYGGVVSYDFEWGGIGNLAERWSYFTGISYGYSMPIAKRLNLDFTIGLGYLGGRYKVYQPELDCYVWQSTQQRHWIGPTKGEISLVWLLGCDNYNRKKGGRQ